jgi:LysR family transcriptional regulator, cys regulon transcriptional activator
VSRKYYTWRGMPKTTILLSAHNIQAWKMNLRQLRYFCHVVDSGYSISAAARALYTSQPGISRQLALLESQVGSSVFTRRGNRIVGMTETGKQVLQVARRMLNDARALQRISEGYSPEDSGRFVVGTTHTHARYVLPGVIRRFTKRYPSVQLVMRQENESRVADLVSRGEADIGVTAQPRESHSDLLGLPCYQLPRSVITRTRHPLLRGGPLTLARIARYPIITLDASFAGGHKVLQAFAQAGLKPSIVMSAIDADVIKAYVALGLGVAILPTICYVVERDKELRARDAKDLFEPTVACIQLRRNDYLPQYMVEFIQLLAPQWTHRSVKEAIDTGDVPRRPVTELSKQPSG